jgi:conjugative transposon TraM protein
MEEQNINIPEQLPKKQPNKQQAIIALSIFGLFVIGITMYGLGVFKDKKEKTNPQENNIEALTPPEAKNKKLENEKYKYDDTYSKKKMDDTPNGIENLRAITGSNPRESQRSNEELNANDFSEVTNSGNPPVQSYREKRRAIASTTQRKIQREQVKQQYYANPEKPLYQKTGWERQQDRENQEDKELNRRTAKAILDNMEKSQQSPSQAPPPPTPNPIIEGNLTPNPYTKIKKQIEPKKTEETEIIPEVDKNTTGRMGKSFGFFYGLNNKNKNSYSDAEGIYAVIHGQGDGIKIENGSILKLRLLENTTLKVNGFKLQIEAGTLLPAVARIQRDRITITAKTLRIDNAIYPITLTVYDLDGQLGLYVPNLADKTTLSREIVNSAGQPLQGTNIFANQGDIGTQVGTQMALQTTNSLLSGVRSYARSKFANAKVTIKPNYKVILKSVNLSSIKEENKEDE